MDKKRDAVGGIRVELGAGTDGAVAVDELVDDFLHGKMNRALNALHEPHGDEPEEDAAAPTEPSA